MTIIVILMNNKEKILVLLQGEKLTVAEISRKLNLTKNDTRTYVNRLKKDNQIISIGKKGRYKLYTIKKHIVPEHINMFQELLYDLNHFFNLYKYKLEFKKDLTPTKEDMLFITSIEERITKFDKFIKNLKESL